MLNPKKLIWTEAYRPRKVSEMVGDFRNKILKYLEEPESLPHFLLYSKAPGTGKSTLMKAIVNELNCDYLILNSSDDRKIEVVRDRVKQFAITQSSKKGLRRAILMDEADGMLKATQDALRNVMETYAKNVFFILSCNNLNKIIEPIQSRCVIVPFKYPDKEEIFNYLKMICESEKLKYLDDGIKKVIELNYPSIRNCVLSLQDLKVEGKVVSEENVHPINEQFEEMWLRLKQKDWKFIKQEVMSTTIDPRELNTFFWSKFLDEENLKGIQITCRNEKDFAYGSDPKIIMVTSIIELCK